MARREAHEPADTVVGMESEGGGIVEYQGYAPWALKRTLMPLSGRRPTMPSVRGNADEQAACHASTRRDYFGCIAAWIAATVSFRASAGLICKNSLPFVVAGT
jgi:hypothetical protein